MNSALAALFRSGTPAGLENNSERAQAIDSLQQILLSQLITSLQRRDHKNTPRMAGVTVNTAHGLESEAHSAQNQDSVLSSRLRSLFCSGDWQAWGQIKKSEAQALTHQLSCNNHRPEGTGCTREVVLRAILGSANICTNHSYKKGFQTH